MSEKSQNYLKNYENIIAWKKNFFTVTFNPTVPVRRHRRPTPNEVKQRVLESPRFKHYVDATSENENEKRKKIAEAIETLDEIAFTRSFVALRSCGAILYRVMGQVYDSISVNMENLANLKAKMGTRQVIYLPCHRSYADFMLMSIVCFLTNLEIPAIAAGMDFHGMMGMGEVLRKTGAFFMRRSFGSDEFYWRIFMDYMHEVMTFNDFGLEFFVEGTRSRSHKALTPKIGLLSMALEPYFFSELYDVMIVPVAISYEKPMEEQLFVYELLGIPKPKESTTGLIKGIKHITNQKMGKIYFDFCEPITLNEYFGKKADKFSHSIEPAFIQKLNSNDVRNITDLANTVVIEQQKKIVIFNYNLIALSYNDFIFSGESTRFSYEDLKKKLVAYTRLFESLGAIVDNDLNALDEGIARTVDLHSNILNIKNGTVDLVKSNVQLANVNPSKLKGVKLSNEVMNVAVPSFSLQLYINPTLFWLSKPSFIILSMLKESEMERSAIRKDYELLRRLFVYEFVLYPPLGDDEFNKAIDDLLKLDIIRTDNHLTFSLNQESSLTNLTISAVAPFLNSYLNTSKVIMAEFRHHEFKEKEVFVAVQNFVQNSILKGKADVHPYTLCLDTITMNILSLCNNDCLYKTKHNSINHFSLKFPQLSDLVAKLEIFNSKLPFQYKYFDVLLPSKM